ncbi:PI-PLC X domain-containing protein 1 isoform X1 [Manis javanica]|uniref:PI-PLC X domain-containing protein 1 isoform X1 n=1 Tax=Manis javanica TaxID=9974 RepID=UPI003C6D6EF0
MCWDRSVGQLLLLEGVGFTISSHPIPAQSILGSAQREGRCCWKLRRVCDSLGHSFTTYGRAGELFWQLPQPAQHHEHGLDVSTVPTALGCARPPPLHPRFHCWILGGCGFGAPSTPCCVQLREVGAVKRAHLLAGSHDTMTYCLNKKSSICHDQSWLLQLLDKVLPFITRPVVMKWSVTQTLNVTEQLDAGVRYLDLRIAHMLEGSEKNLHFVHLVYTTALVEDTLTEVSDWLEQHPREVVILACRNFEGMTEGLHEYLVTCIQNIFGDMLCPRGEVPTLRQLWARGQQVLVSYEDEGTVSRHGALWPRIPYWWGDQVKPEKLVHYLESMKSGGRPGGLFVAGINLTENLAYILLHPSESLKKMTLPSLPYLSRWVREQCPGPGAQCTNIIAGDFIGTDAFTSDVIRLNEKLLPC